MDTSIKEPVVVADEQTGSQKELERKLIKSFAGNYKVSFKFAETFAPDMNYEYHERKFSQAKEVVLLIEETEDKISLQHILFVGTHVIKHWRQDWLYENRDLFKLIKNHDWKKVQLTAEEARGTWTQKVYQVDDCLRYEGFGTWVHVDGRHYWESTADAALPRREISKRSDYNVLQRHSHIEIFEDGSWVIDQDNQKIIRSADEKKDTLLCMEKGLETFTPANYDPSFAKEWWKGQQEFWADVREIWSEIIDSKDQINVSKDEDLYMAQFELAEKFSKENYNREKATAAIKSLLEKHVEDYKA